MKFKELKNIKNKTVKEKIFLTKNREFYFKFISYFDENKKDKFICLKYINKYQHEFEQCNLIFKTLEEIENHKHRIIEHICSPCCFKCYECKGEIKTNEKNKM